MAILLRVLSPNKCFQTTARLTLRIGGAKAEAWRCNNKQVARNENNRT